jgi:hypothetical protein
MFKIYTLSAIRHNYDGPENPHYEAKFSSLPVAQSAFRIVADRLNFEIDDDAVSEGYASRTWEADDVELDSIFVLSITCEEVYESYEEEREAYSRNLEEVKARLASAGFKFQAGKTRF